MSHDHIYTDANPTGPEPSKANDSIVRFIARIRERVATVVVGQEVVVERLLIALFTGGHVLLQGVPGIAKTLLASAVSRAIDLTFARVQFTIDLLPSDILDPRSSINVATSSSRSRAQFLRTCCWRMKSIEPPPKSRERCWRQCRNVKLPLAR